ncbi:MurR/RpiR family transcriptional regulator [Arthrobacter sp. B2a2-09]|uniref:MurR/RpiR family transcriptional regulator n=1 Tax=Arthrobacter sp. B2a2-09 TaxID=2952822 RepID=UPI0022CD6A9F|nr:MurR/RpiR family transcriptional regulator [Arthrobacter sp. B2a2-09]MCZ9882282.1 MurR/RpiR family transcriptional regulator [Arthrobacter sp. B2a2-09]
MRIDERIEQHYPALGPQEQLAADTILNHLGDLAVYNAAELARLSGVSKATVSRLFRRLGFADFNEVKEHTRALRSSGVPLATRDSDGGLPTHAAMEQRNLQRLFESIDEARLSEVANLVAGARNVLLIGFRNSFPLALHLRQQLLQCRDGIGLAPQPGQSVGEELAGLGPADAVVLLGFRRRPEAFSNVLKAAAKTGASTILIGDASGRRMAGDAKVWIECPVEGNGAFDSYAAAMSLLSVLANAVLAAMGRPGTKRISEITGLFDSLGEIEGLR